jgi:hypothetical protein
MAFTDTVVTETRPNAWREPEATPDRHPVRRDAPTWSEAEALGAEAESWLSTRHGITEPADQRPDIDLARPEEAAPFRRRPKNTWREPLDGVGRRTLG